MASRAAFWTQFLALMRRNFYLKKRNRNSTIQEFLLPVFFVALLGVLRVIISPHHKPEISSFPEYSLDTYSYIAYSDLLVSPDTAFTRSLVYNLTLALVGSFNNSLFFKTSTGAEDYYTNNVTNHSLFIGLDFAEVGPTQVDYSLRFSSTSVPKTSDFFGSQGTCRKPDEFYTCPVHSYLHSGFIKLQITIDTLLIQYFKKNASYIIPEIHLQQMPKSGWLSSTTSFQAFTSIYLVIAYSVFVIFMLVAIVTEKEKKIKDVMCLMGLRPSALWLSWGATYVIVITIVTVIITILTWVTKLFQTSNFFYIFLLLLLYGYSVITFSFLMATFFTKAEAAGAVGSTVTTLFSLAYLGVAMTRTNYTGPGGPVSKVPVSVQWLMSLFSPVAFALGIDQSMFLDISEGGLNTDNLWYGEFPVAASLIMLSVDFVLYGLLALYLDNVIPDQNGQRLSPYFCFMPSYWCSRSRSQADMINVLHPDIMATSDQDPNLVEPVSGELADKNVIRICNVKKTFDGKNKKPANALKGLNLDIYEGQITAILGHNGAGKSTLMNIMAGMMPPSSGEVFIYNMCVTDGGHRGNICALLGVCPQYNILLPELTSNEHLRLFAAIKNVPPNDIPKVVDTILAEVDLTEQKNTEAKKLSGGQQRKLSLALALIGDPKVLLLDEPTAGLDPLSRRHIWTVLKDRCRDRVILLATHYMDEADILADRKAFLSKGNLKYIGSSLFLKNRFGLGYHVGLVVDTDADRNKITSLVQSHIPEFSLKQVSNRELTYTVPLCEVDNFPQLLNAIEDAITDQSHGIKTYGVSMTTLEEVFLKIGIDEEVEESDKECNPLLSQGHNYQEMGVMEGTSQLNDIQLDYFNPEDDINIRSVVKHVSLQQFTALCKVRVTHLFRNKSSFIFRIIVPVIFLLLGVILITYISPALEESQPLKLTPEYYVNTSLSRENSNFVYLVSENAVGQNWETFVNKLEQLDVGTLQISNVTSLLHIQPHHLGANVYDMSKNHITVLYNDTAVHSLPIGLNLLSNALAAMVGPIAMPLIKTNSNPWPVQDFTGKEYTSFAAAMFIGLAMVYVPASLAMLLVREREKKIFNQLRVSSVSYMVYWISAFSSDIAQLFAIALCAIIIIFAFQVKSLVTGGAMLCLCLMYLLYLPLNLILAYAMTFGFSSFEKAQNVMYNIYTLIVIIPSMAVSFLDVTGHTSIADGLHYLFCVIDPPYVFIQIIYYINKVYLMSVVLQGPNVSIPISAYFTWDSNILIIFLPPFVHIPLLVLLIRYLETRHICCKTNQSELKKERVLINYRQLQENLHGEDTDVQEERDRVKRLVLEQPPSNTSVPAVAVDSISKVYVGSKSISPCSSREPCIKHAVNNLSFSVNKGEVFGLLGPNGAGKSTTINMITAQTASSRGKITVGGVGVSASLSYNQLGYCPQHDALYDDITLREHLDLYIALRGYSKKMRRAIINYYSQLLQLDDHLNKHVSKLSGGTKRKLSYCMAMIGRPSLVLLDEPSTGLDPKSKRRLWDAVNQTFSQREKAAILTTHYMEEADALCTRIAIMINGQMVCLGSAQHLKNKYGSGYMLEVKLSRSNNQRSNALHQYITTLIPGAERAEHFAERATYRISQSAICSIAEIFKSLQQNKETLNIEDYSFSQSTLEQVFLRFARRQSDARDTDRVIDLNVSHHNLIEQRESPV